MDGRDPAREPPFLGMVRRFLEFKARHKHTWASESTGFFLAEARRKWKRYPAHVIAWNALAGSSPATGLLAADGGRMSSGIMRTHVFPRVVEWFDLVFNAGKPCIAWVDGRVVNATSCLMKCRFFVNFTDIKPLAGQFPDINVIAGGMSEREFIRVMFESILAGLDAVLASECGSPWHFVQYSNVLELRLQEFSVALVIGFTRDQPHPLKRSYFEGNLLEFLTNVLGMSLSPPEIDILEARRRALKEEARALYHGDRGAILSTVNHFQAMASLAGKVSHLYPVLSYLVSRLDLANTSVQALMEMYARNRSLSEGTALLLSYLFNETSEHALLFSTFQANVTGFKDKLGTLFMIVLQYYLVVLERRALSEKLLDGELLFKNVEHMVTAGGFEQFASRFQEFLVNHFKVQDMPEYNLLVHLVFQARLERLLARFFASFLKTSNERLARVLDTLNAKASLSRELSMGALIDFIGGFLAFGVQQVFLQEDLARASKMFKDPRNRFSEDNIAMAMLELLLHKEMPFQDNQWMPVLATSSREGLDLAFLPRKAEIDEKLKGMSKEMLQQFTIQDRAEKTTTPFLQEFFFNEILKPFHAFLAFHGSKKYQADPVAALLARGRAMKVGFDAGTARAMAGMLDSLLGPAPA